MSTLVLDHPTLAPRAPVARASEPMNVMSIDLEDWFHVSNFSGIIPQQDWPWCAPRLQETVPRLLDLFAKHNVRATFFALGWVARKYPQLVRRISEAGHELATHGDEHQLMTRQSPREFRAQLRRSRDAIEQAGGQRTYGHRAPTFSFRKSTDWAIDTMIEEGFQYDSSVFPFGARFDPELRVGRAPCLLTDVVNMTLVEYPLSTWRVAGQNVPIAGGGYFRFLPYWFVRCAMEQLIAQGHRIITYFHPWEIDPWQPRVQRASWLAKFRHYHQLEHTEAKLDQLLSDFRFGSFREVYWSAETGRYEALPQA